MSRKSCTHIFASLLVSLLTLPSLALAKDYYVHAGVGDNRNGGNMPNDAFADLEYALARLRAGDTLHVRAGTYATIKIPQGVNGTKAQPIIVRSYQNEKPTISANRKYRFFDNRWWVLEDLTFRNSQAVKLGVQDSGKCMSYAKDIVFRRNVFIDSSYAPIKIQCGRRIQVVDNVFDNLRSRIAGIDVHAVQLSFSNEDVVISGNTFRDIGGDGVQINGYLRNIEISSNLFEVVRPYVYRDLNGKAVPKSEQPFDYVGENAIDIKNGPGPIKVIGNEMRGFRPSTPGQDATGSIGQAITVHDNASGIIVRKNHFYDNTFHIRIGGVGASTALPNRDIEVSNNVFADVADDPQYYVPTALDLGNVSGIRVYNNTFFNLGDGSGKRLLKMKDVRDITLQNNSFYNGSVIKPQASYVTDVYADQNAWSSIYGEIDSSFTGLRDIRIKDPALDWSNWSPKTGSPLIDAGMTVGISDDYYGAQVMGVAPDIGAVEYGSQQATSEESSSLEQPSSIKEASTSVVAW